MFNIGIKQPIEHILEVANEHRPDAIGLSGLLVKSTVIMRENLEEMKRRGVDTPVILGGAALTRNYVESDCRKVHDAPVYYAQDAFEGLDVMERVMSGEPTPAPADAKASGATAHARAMEAQEKAEEAAERAKQAASVVGARPEPEEDAASPERSAIERDIAYPKAPFFGPRLVEGISMRTILPYINTSTLFGFQWGYRRKNTPRTEHEEFIEKEVRPILHELSKQCEDEEILVPKAIYGFWPCIPEAETLILLDPQDFGRESRASRSRARRGRRTSASRTSSTRTARRTSSRSRSAPSARTRPTARASGSPPTATRTTSTCTGSRSRPPRASPSTCTRSCATSSASAPTTRAR